MNRLSITRERVVDAAGGLRPTVEAREDVRRIVADIVDMIRGGRDGHVHSAVLAVCALLGITEVYAAGGAQAIAAMALGTESIPAVDVVVGPGNAYVEEAKRRMFGEVGIESLAGPSELIVLSDG